MGLTLIVADHIRRKLNLQPYRGTEQEARRFVEELRMYERMVNRFQYRNSDDVLRDAVLHLPIEPNGVETDPVEVAVNRNLARVETNRVRGGALRVVNDGLLGRAQKVLRIIDRLGLQGWDWLRALKTLSGDGQSSPSLGNREASVSDTAGLETQASHRLDFTPAQWRSLEDSLQ